MKTIISTTFLSTIILFNCLLAKAEIISSFVSDTNSCLIIAGKIYSNETGDSYRIELITDNECVSEYHLKENNNKFYFRLSKNKTYAIRISKRGFITKLIYINTELPNGTNEVFEFKFIAKLLKQDESYLLNQEALDFPFAFVFFNTQRKCFDYNRKYTKTVRRIRYDRGVEVDFTRISPSKSVCLLI